MKKILIVGPLLSISGYGYHSRQIFNFFKNNLNYEVSSVILPWGNTSWFLNGDLEKGLIQDIIKSAIDKNSIVSNSFDIGVHIQLPNEWETKYAKTNIGVSAFVETDICSREWLKSIDKVDKVIVPSSFTKDVILNSEKDITKKDYYKNKVVVIPEYYHDSFDQEEVTKSENLEDLLTSIPTSKNFLTVGQLTSPDKNLDRKNLIKTIEVFCNQFKNSKDVGLIVKTSLGRSTSLDRKNTRTVFNNIIKKIKKENVYPRVYLLHGDLSPDELKQLYTHEKVNCYISLTRGEGYGLPLLEAARCNLPVIATNWSGHLDFLKDNFIKIDYTLDKIPDQKVDGRIFVQDAKWANFKTNSVLKALKSIENIKIKKNSKFYIDNFSKKSIEKLYKDFFSEYL